MSFLIVASLIFSHSSYGKEWQCDLIKKLPREFEGCEGEACGMLTYERTIKDVDIFKAIADKKPFAKAPKCSLIRYFEPFYVLKKAGKLKFLKALPEHKVQVNDVAFYTKSLGEGYFDVCLEGKTVQISALPSPQAEENKENAVILSWTESEHWIRLKLDDGKKGYAKNDGGFWYQGYYSYEPDQHCDDPRFPKKQSHETREDCFKVVSGLKCANGKYKKAAPPSCSILECEY